VQELGGGGHAQFQVTFYESGTTELEIRYDTMDVVIAPTEWALGVFSDPTHFDVMHLSGETGGPIADTVWTFAP
jgi:hypothetical protein